MININCFKKLSEFINYIEIIHKLSILSCEQ